MNPEQFSDVRLEIEDKIAKVIINRPDKLNAIRIQTYRELISALKAADDSPDSHVILLMGEGGQFTAGNDLADLVGDNREEVMECVQSIFDTAAGLQKVVLAAVEGVAVGIGTTILLHCDIAVASKKARFRLPFANLGVCPEGASSLLLPQAIGHKNAAEILLTGRFFSADEALSWGLINGISEPGKAEEMVFTYIDQLLKQPLESLIATKRLLRPAKPDVGRAVNMELQEFARLLDTKETRFRIQTVLQR